MHPLEFFIAFLELTLLAILVVFVIRLDSRLRLGAEEASRRRRQLDRRARSEQPALAPPPAPSAGDRPESLAARLAAARIEAIESAATVAIPAALPAARREEPLVPRTPIAAPIPIAARPPAAPPPSPRAPVAPPVAAPAVPGRSIELRLGRSLPIIIGAIALVLAGVWLVRVFAERGMLPPGLRIGLGGAFAALLLATGELFRTRVEAIGRALTVAGLLVGFATIGAAHRLYDFIGVAPALLLEGGLAALSIRLGRRFGSPVTAFGLVAGYLVPALVGPASLDTAELFGFLLLLEIGLALDARVRASPWLGAAAVIATYLWYLLWLTGATGAPAAERLDLVPALFLLASTFVGVPALLPLGFRSEDETRCALVPGLALALLHWWLVRTEPSGAVGLGLFATATVIAALLRPTVRPYTIPLAIAGWFALTWAFPRAADRAEFGVGIAALAALFCVVPVAFALRRREERTIPACSGAIHLALLALLAVLALPGGDPPGGWGVWLLGGALAAAAVAALLGRGLARPGEDPAVVAFAWVSIGLAAWAAGLGLERSPIGVAWALLALLVAVIDRRGRLTGAGAIAGALLIAAGLRLLANPWLAEYPIDPSPLWNWLPIGYGAPALCAGAVGSIFARGRRKWISPLLTVESCLFALALVTLLVRHAFHPEAATLFAGGAPTPGEGLAYSIAWIISAVAIFALAVLKNSRLLRHVGLAVMVLAVGKVFLRDTRSLDDLYRVASYLGLGVSLVAIGWAYHRWLPRAMRRAAPAVAVGEEARGTEEPAEPER